MVTGTVVPLGCCYINVHVKQKKSNFFPFVCFPYFRGALEQCIKLVCSFNAGEVQTLNTGQAEMMIECCQDVCN